MIDLETLDLRTLQKEAAKALASYINATNNGLAEVNKKCNHDSTIFYKEVIKLYIDKFGNLPSKVGPGKNVSLVSDKY
mgnify:CR=1 FL=1|tara:strand:- start:2224 stop:2457 length:234 start_codon:yes stop_codon:yes gene_type:complete